MNAPLSRLSPSPMPEGPAADFGWASCLLLQSIMRVFGGSGCGETFGVQGSLGFSVSRDGRRSRMECKGARNLKFHAALTAQASFRRGSVRRSRTSDWSHEGLGCDPLDVTPSSHLELLDTIQRLSRSILRPGHFRSYQGKMRKVSKLKHVAAWGAPEVKRGPCLGSSGCGAR